VLWFRLLVLQVLFVGFEFFLHKKSVNVFSVLVANVEVVLIVCRLVLLLDLCSQIVSFIFFDGGVLEGSYFLRVFGVFLKCGFFGPHTGFRVFYDFF